MQIFNILDSLSKSDLKLLNQLYIDTDKISNQYKNCFKSNSPIQLTKVATLNDGIINLSDSEQKELVKLYHAKVNNYTIEKFVPASGAATRMFKFLTDFITQFNPSKETINGYINKYKAHDLTTFFTGLEKFSFFEPIYKHCLEVFPNFETFSQDNKHYYFVKVMLEKEYFGYSKKPKALIPFHKIDNLFVTPIASHLEEAKGLMGKKGKIHFTVSKGFEEDFLNEIKALQSDCSISFSNQMAKTDSVAFDLDGSFFRQANEKLLFRPGGHGALIENLNALKSDIVFIKNIDNVSLKHLDNIIFYKKVLGGVLFKNQETIFNILRNFDKVSTQENIIEILNFMEKKLNIFVPNHIKVNSTFDVVKSFIKDKLNRPIRVCGMVKNEGEPGGGPFWTKNAQNEISLQIVESAQVNKNDIKQQLILSQATHFNPVDLVCGIRNYLGKKFDLKNYVDHNSGFVVEKSHEGRDLKAYELPGLWNGAMADWITIFVEVPIETFNPVKTVNDLLKPAHVHKKPCE
ncbi:DUF4301 family protein [Flavobacterium agricola]|uniref:DUF4301 family protein n=1 Tax=Flavobacterium agricola TaxID=2870839 RepID=A0ABY6LX15_9FLAO|nr:DUF4301 family protein [Flavobacterium agricola]UYW00821.1 DUF4301 family protein [Flavobacterium agricola]